MEQARIGDHSLDFSDLDLPVLDLNTLDAPFIEEEVWQTSREMPVDKNAV
uniref:Uncharacterized protein n=1 Tax=Arundo donax TaxID=35708 RepID=A0A0A9CFK0_ARUDO